MSFELAVKLITALVGILGVGKIIYEYTSGLQSKLREEYKFAKEFLGQEKLEELHPFAREKGYQAIAGSSIFTQKEIEYILSLSNPAQRLKDYKKAKLLFEKMETEGKFKLTYRKKYNSAWMLKWRKGFYIFSYSTLAFLAVSPMIFTNWFGEQGILFLIITLPSFGFYAYISLNEFSKIISAERLVKNQTFHTSNILLQ